MALQTCHHILGSAVITTGSGADGVYFGGGGIDSVLTSFGNNLFTTRFVSIESTLFGAFDANVDAFGFTFAAIYTLRGGNPADLIC